MPSALGMIGSAVGAAAQAAASIANTNAAQFQSRFNQVTNLANQNTARSEAQAAELRDWQAKQAEIARDFNAKEAAKNRDWQEYMSSTAHQREVRDLQLAGLNPILSAMGGNGASTGSGATASASAPGGAKGDVDRSATTAMVSLLGAFLNAQTQLEAVRTSAESNQAIAERNNASAELIAQINGMYGNERARIAGQYGYASSQLQAVTSRQNAEIAAMTSLLNNQRMNATSKSVAEINSETQRNVAKIQEATTKRGQDITQITAKQQRELQRELNISTNQWNAAIAAMQAENQFNIARYTQKSSNKRAAFQGMAIVNSGLLSLVSRLLG